MIKNAKIIISGIGSQGVLLSSKILGYAGFLSNKNVSLLPNHDLKIRGGSVNCQLIFSDTKIKSPIIDYADILVAFHKNALKLQYKLKSKGILLYNNSIINNPIPQKNTTNIPIQASLIAISLGNELVTNMVMIGALWNIIENDEKFILKSIKHNLSNDIYSKLIPLNIKALNKGKEAILKFYN